MRSVKRSHPGFIYEPIVSVSGVILGFELVKKTDQRESSENSLDYTSPFSAEEKVRGFFEQVTTACMNENIFIANGFLLSINIDYEIAAHIANNLAIQKVLQQHKYIRLEVKEDFSEFNAGQECPVLQSLAACCPLWLDNFGAGHTSLTLVMSEKFEYIKISKVFFWQHQGTQSLRKVIDHLRPYCRGVIVNGVENSQHIEYLSGSDIRAMQGTLWQPYSQDELVQSFF
ncbi:EAL domain-containing protein (putative c-di-GMP-specific phosphodiesterase class I) [Rahnella sp. BIGb0236]|uniref:EAL domain-containing protein n=1 Tax=Rahnella sp. BIGb0236 TaxID=2485117 RepID=UPI0010602FD4|nr:EAL domain-containing protein [Rahnella sp. BIGb0236]TDS86229.1 EAL domain-containing protein (putative c-di-GMP-specific phosphodiesterase class I) [Rahnella sp. BIGb0236]